MPATGLGLSTLPDLIVGAHPGQLCLAALVEAQCPR